MRIVLWPTSTTGNLLMLMYIRVGGEAAALLELPDEEAKALSIKYRRFMLLTKVPLQIVGLTLTLMGARIVAPPM
jgi:hypothetical protein